MNISHNTDGKRQLYIIFSVDTEHDIVSRFESRTSGWLKGIPLLLDTFDILGMTSKVCWLIEYNIKEGIPARNPDSAFYIKEFPDFIKQFRSRGDELGIHPTMYDWVGNVDKMSATAYIDPKLWDFERSYKDPEFVMHVIHSSVIEFEAAVGINPVGCRTANHHYSINLPIALEKNGISIDGSVSKKGISFGKPPTAYYPDFVDIRLKSKGKTPILEFPSFPSKKFDLQDPLLRIRIELLLKLRQPVFLSLYTHNWNAITQNGKKDDKYLGDLISFIHFLCDHGATILSWTEAKQKFDLLYGSM